MKLISQTGAVVAVSERAWPMANLDYPMPQSNGGTVIQFASSPGQPPNYNTYAQIYRSNPWVFASVQAIASGLGRMPLYVYQLNAAGDRERVRGDLPGSGGRPDAGAALDNLIQQPEPGVSKYEWVRKVVADKLVYGNAGANPDCPGPASLPTALWHTPWKRVEIIPGESVPVLAYKVKGTQGANVIDNDDFIHFGRGTDLDGPLGISALAPLRHTLALHDALQRHLNAYFANAARPSGILKVQPGTNKDAQLLIQEQVRKLYSGVDQAGKIMVTSAEFQSLSESPHSAQIIELAKLSREEIAAAFQVPPPVLGILDRAIKSNMSELRSQFIRDVIGPHAAAIEDEINIQLIRRFPRWRGYFVAFDLDEALRPDLEARATVYQQMKAVWTPNEMRRMEKLPPLTGDAGKYADTVWMPSGEIPLGLVQPQEDAATGDGPGADPLDGGGPAPEPGSGGSKP